MVELQFKENPPRTPKAAYRVRLVRERADLGGATRATQRVKAYERLQKEWVEQRLSNKESNAMVFAEPLAEDSPGGLREWVGVILGPDTSVYAGHAFQVYIHT